MSTIISLVYQPSKTLHEPPYQYNRVPADTLDLVAGHGIKGDHKAGRNPNRQVNIMSQEEMDELAQRGWRTAPGEMGEQIVISGLVLGMLPPGTLIHLGRSAIVEVAALRTGCAWLEQVQGRNRSETAGKIGVMGRVITSGNIAVGDVVRVTLPEITVK
jgi:MOSC domain-containing protein YiiM